MSDLDDELRRAFNRPHRPGADVENVLRRVHAGARRRKRRRAVAASALTVALITGGGWGLSSAVLQETSPDPGPVGPVATTPQGTPTHSERTPRRQEAPPDESQTTDSFPAQTGASLTEISVTSMTAVSSSHFWALGSVPCSSPPCVTIAETEDGGDSFTPVEAPPANVGEIRFVGDGEDGWAFGEGLWSTHDGATSWQRVDLPVGGRVVALEAWGTAAYALVETGSKLAVLRTPVGHDAWTNAGLPRLDSSSPELVVGDGQIAIHARKRASGELVVISSTDGATWTEHEQPCPSEHDGQISGSADSLWLQCALGSASRSYVSTDAGATWRDVPNQVSAPNSALIGARSADAAVTIAGGDVVRVAPGREAARAAAPKINGASFVGFTNPSTGYIVTQDGRLLRSTDSGATWATVDFAG